MANNLIVSYDLYNPGQDYSKVIEAIKGLGDWAKVHKSVWYVKSAYSSSEAVSAVWATMDSNDSLVVVDATNNSVSWQNLNSKVESFLKEHWLS